MSIQTVRLVDDGHGGMPVYPQQHGRWTGNNSFGTKTVFNPSLTSRLQVAKLPEDGWPEIWTVQLGIQAKQANICYPDPGMTGNIFAEIEFGSGGTTDTVEIDWALGASISIPMNACTVFVHWDTGPRLTPPNVELNVDVTFSRGTKRGESPTRKLNNILSQSGEGLVSPSTNGGFIIPARTTVKLLLPKYSTHFFMPPFDFHTRENYAATPSVVDVEFQNPNGPTSRLFPPDYFPNGIRIPQLTTHVQISNTSGLDVDDCLVFPFAVIGL